MATRTETRDVTGFSAVAIRGHGHLKLLQGEREGLVIEADESVLPKIRSEVVNGKLVLGFDLQWWEWLTWAFMPFRDVRYTVTVSDFTGASVSGSGDVTAEALSGDACEFRISGSGKMVLGNLSFRSLAMHISGSGRVQMAGKTARQELHISGSGDVRNADLETDDTIVRISGSGNASVNARDRLDVHISGSGAVFYRGQPKVTQHISGAGKVGAA